MHDLGELRSLLDECAQVVALSAEALLSYTNLIIHSPIGAGAGDADEIRTIVVDDGTMELRGPFPPVDEAGERIHREAAPIFGLYQRVLLRLGQNHSVTLALRELHRLYATWPIEAQEVDDVALGTPGRAEAVDRWRHEVREAHFVFLAACHYLVRSKLTDDRVPWWAGRFRRGTDGGTEPAAVPDNEPALTEPTGTS